MKHVTDEEFAFYITLALQASAPPQHDEFEAVVQHMTDACPKPEASRERSVFMAGFVAGYVCGLRHGTKEMQIRLAAHLSHLLEEDSDDEQGTTSSSSTGSVAETSGSPDSFTGA